MWCSWGSTVHKFQFYTFFFTSLLFGFVFLFSSSCYRSSHVFFYSVSLNCAEFHSAMKEMWESFLVVVAGAPTIWRAKVYNFIFFLFVASQFTYLLLHIYLYTDWTIFISIIRLLLRGCIEFVLCDWSMLNLNDAIDFSRENKLLVRFVAENVGLSMTWIHGKSFQLMMWFWVVLVVVVVETIYCVHSAEW